MGQGLLFGGFIRFLNELSKPACRRPLLQCSYFVDVDYGFRVTVAPCHYFRWNRDVHFQSEAMTTMSTGLRVGNLGALSQVSIRVR